MRIKFKNFNKYQQINNRLNKFVSKNKNINKFQNNSKKFNNIQKIIKKFKKGFVRYYKVYDNFYKNLSFPLGNKFFFRNLIFSFCKFFDMKALFNNKKFELSFVNNVSFFFSFGFLKKGDKYFNRTSRDFFLYFNNFKRLNKEKTFKLNVFSFFSDIKRFDYVFFFKSFSSSLANSFFFVKNFPVNFF
jgi:hypothetical protein